MKNTYTLLKFIYHHVRLCIGVRSYYADGVVYINNFTDYLFIISVTVGKDRKYVIWDCRKNEIIVR